MLEVCTGGVYGAGSCGTVLQGCMGYYCGELWDSIAGMHGILLQGCVGQYCGNVCDITSGSCGTVLWRVVGTVLRECIGYYCGELWDSTAGSLEPLLRGVLWHYCSTCQQLDFNALSTAQGHPRPTAKSCVMLLREVV